MHRDLSQFRSRSPLFFLPLALFFASAALLIACETSDSVGETRITNDLAIFDVDSDGVLDLALARRRKNDPDTRKGDVSIVLQDAQDDEKFNRLQSPRSGRNPRSIVAVDLDQDGQIEIITANRAPSTASFFYRDPKSPPRFQKRIDMDVGARPADLEAIDLDGDGWLDLVFANLGDDSISILYQDSDFPGSFEVERRVPVGFSQRSIAVADVNRDGRLDLVAAGEDQTAWLPAAAGSARAFATARVVLDGGRPVVVEAKDLDGDGWVDFVIGDRDSAFGRMHVLLQDASAPGAFLPTVFETIEKPTDLKIVDVNGDGFRDVVLSSFFERDFETDRGWITVYLQDASRPGRLVVSSDQRLRGETNKVKVIDMNGDGALDIVTASTGARALFGIPGAPGFFEDAVILKK